MQFLNFNRRTIVSIPVFMLGLILIFPSVSYFNHEASARCPNGTYKSPSGDCVNPLSQQDNQTDMPKINITARNGSSLIDFESRGIAFACNYNIEPEAECSRGMAWLKVECDRYYSVSEVCRENRPNIKRYLLEKAFDDIDIKYYHDEFQRNIGR